MMTKITNVSSLWTLLKSESYNQISWFKTFWILVSMFLPVPTLIFLLFQFSEVNKEFGADAVALERELARLSTRLLAILFLLAGVPCAYAVRLSTIFFEGRYVQKNQLSFLRYGKYEVVLAKMIVDFLFFLLHLLLIVATGMISLVFWAGGTFNNESFQFIGSIILAASIAYLFISYGTRLLYAFLYDKKYRTVFMILWFSGTIVFYIGMVTMHFGITDFLPYFRYFKYIPVLNSVTPLAFILQAGFTGIEELHLLDVLPITGVTITFISVTIGKFGAKLKESLCTS